MHSVQLEILLGMLAFTAATLLGLFIYRSSPRSWTNRLFLVLAFLIDAYILINFLSLHPPLPTPETQLFWIRAVMFVCSFIGPTLLLLVHTFPREHMTLRPRYYIPLFVLMTLSAAAAFTPLTFSGIEYPNGEPIPTAGPGIGIFILDFVGLFVLSFIVLAYKYKVATGEERARLFHLLAGVLASFSLMGLFTVLFVVILKTSSFVFLGPILPVILIGFIGYAIVKHNMFNVKVFASQALVFTLWVFLFAQIFAAQTPDALLTDGFIFIAMLIFGTMLIRSVRHEIAQREKIQELATELEIANRKQEGLIHFISHEVKGALGKCAGVMSLIMEGDLGPTPDPMKEAVGRGLSDTRGAVDMVTTLLLSANVKSGAMKFDMQPFDFLKDAIEPIFNQLKLDGEKKGLTMKLEPKVVQTCRVLGDKDMLSTHVVRNLIDNAVRYTPAGEVSVGLECADDKVVLRIKDSGVGITDEDKARLFTEGGRGKDSVKVNVNSTGYGLYFAKQIVETHKGTIRAESEGQGKGSTFVVELPLAS